MIPVNMIAPYYSGHLEIAKKMKGKKFPTPLNATLFHPDYTVGSRITLDLLTFSVEKRSRAQAQVKMTWALPPVGSYTPP
jgi:hypothetical protein